MIAMIGFSVQLKDVHLQCCMIMQSLTLAYKETQACNFLSKQQGYLFLRLSLACSNLPLQYLAVGREAQGTAACSLTC